MRGFAFRLANWNRIREGEGSIIVHWPPSGEAFGRVRNAPETYQLCKELVKRGFRLEVRDGNG